MRHRRIAARPRSLLGLQRFLPPVELLLFLRVAHELREFGSDSTIGAHDPEPSREPARVARGEVPHALLC